MAKDFEVLKSGIFDSRITMNHADGFITPVRRVEYYEIEFFLEDGGTTYINETRYSIKRGYVLLAKPGQLRHSKLNFKTSYVHLNVYDEELISFLNSFPDFFEIAYENSYYSLILKIKDTYETATSESVLYLKSKVYELLYMLSLDKNRSGKLPPDFDTTPILNSIQFIKENFNKPITLENISASANLSPVYFHRLFKTFSGKTPLEYLNDIRIKNAKKLLLTTNKTVEEIAFSCGFNSQSYFNIFFKKQLGITPMQFKKTAVDDYEI